jgi:hypothetical protein
MYYIVPRPLYNDEGKIAGNCGFFVPDVLFFRGGI